MAGRGAAHSGTPCGSGCAARKRAFHRRIRYRLCGVLCADLLWRRQSACGSLDLCHTLCRRLFRPNHTVDAIQAKLDATERKHGVKVLYAIESGSRGWGFASEDSDFDVRFIYVHKPEWYLGVAPEEKRDVLELVSRGFNLKAQHLLFGR